MPVEFRSFLLHPENSTRVPCPSPSPLTTEEWRQLGPELKNPESGILRFHPVEFIDGFKYHFLTHIFFDFRRDEKSSQKMLQAYFKIKI